MFFKYKPTENEKSSVVKGSEELSQIRTDQFFCSLPDVQLNDNNLSVKSACYCYKINLIENFFLKSYTLCIVPLLPNIWAVIRILENSSIKWPRIQTILVQCSGPSILFMPCYLHWLRSNSGEYASVELLPCPSLSELL